MSTDQEQIGKQTQDLLRSLRKTLKWQDILNVYGQTVELIDVQPKNLRENSVPVLLVPGFSGNAEVVRAHAHELVKNGRRVLCVNAPHGVRAEHVQSSLPQMRKAIALVGTLERKKISKVDAVGYSEAAITMAAAARIAPHLFRNIVLMNPAGLIANDSIVRLVASFLVDKIHEGVGQFFRNVREPHGVRERRRRALDIMREKIRSVFLDPLQSAREVHSISTTSIHVWLRTLQEEHDIGVALVQSQGDRVFPLRKTKEFVKKAGIPHNHIFTDLHGTHDVVLTNPEHAMEIAEKVLRVLESR